MSSCACVETSRTAIVQDRLGKLPEIILLRFRISVCVTAMPTLLQISFLILWFPQTERRISPLALFTKSRTTTAAAGVQDFNRCLCRQISYLLYGTLADHSGRAV
jgi:hypothetical protein